MKQQKPTLFLVGRGWFFFVQSFFSKITIIDVVFLVQMHVYSFNSMRAFFVPRNFLFEIT